MKKKRIYRIWAGFAVAAVLLFRFPVWGAGASLHHSFNSLTNAFFFIDSDNLYGHMTAPARRDGRLYVQEEGQTLYIPLVYKNFGAPILDDWVSVTLSLEEAAKGNVKTMTYSMKAEKAFSRTDPAACAYVAAWQPDLKEKVGAGAFEAKIHIQARVLAGSGQRELEVEETFVVVFSDICEAPETDASEVPDETDASEESKPDETKESETSSPDETQESETSSPDETQESETLPPDETWESEEPRPDEPDEGADSGFGENNGSSGPVSLGDGGSAGEDDPERPEAAPRVRLISCRVDLEEIHPGDQVMITAVLKNSSAASGIKDIRVLYESATGEVLPVNPTNSIYMDAIGAGNTWEFSFPVKVSPNVTSNSQKITLTVEYTDKTAATLSSTENIFLQIVPSFELKVDSPVMAPEIMADSTQDITVNVYNTGNSSVKNIICTLDMPGVTPAGSAFGGDVMAGESKAIVLKTFVGAPEGEDGKKAYGSVMGTVLVQYEDADGQVYHQEVTVVSKIIPPEGEEIQEENVERSSQWWISIVCGLAAVQAVILILIGVHRKRSV